MLNRITWLTGQLSSRTFFNRLMTLLGYHFMLLSDRRFRFRIETQISCRWNTPLRSLMKCPIKAELPLMDRGLPRLLTFHVMQGLEQKQTAVTLLPAFHVMFSLLLWNVFARSLPTDIEITTFWQMNWADETLMAVLEQGHFLLPTLPPRSVHVNEDGGQRSEQALARYHCC